MATAMKPAAGLATRIPRALRQAIKLHCMATDTTIADFVSQAIAEKLAGDAKRRGASATRLA